MTAQKVKQKDRKVNVLVGLTQDELKFLDRKTNKNDTDLSSRSAVVRWIVRYAMMHPAVLDKRYDKE